MVTRSKDCALSRWNDFFFACRTAVRTQAGLKAAEFILPLLVLDRICFGNAEDEEMVRQEIIDALSFDTQSSVIMDLSERQKAVNALFITIDTLSFWAERETEERNRGRSTSSSTNAKRRVLKGDAGDAPLSKSWPSDESIDRIDDVLKTIPLSLQASAAANVGMHARALRLLEMAARGDIVDAVYNCGSEQQGSKVGGGTAVSRTVGDHILSGIDLSLLKDVLTELDDCESMVAVGEGSSLANPSARVWDSIRQKEASGNWEAALQDYERALQFEDPGLRDPRIKKGALQCLLELGQFESVLNQVTGLMHQATKTDKSNDNGHIVPLAVEAAWRLGRWQSLSGLIESEKPEVVCQGMDSEGAFQIAVGKAMLGLQRKEPTTVSSALQNAREALMQSLSSAARESYARSYSHIVRLHCLREIENASDVLCEEMTAVTLAEVAKSNSHEGWLWDGRLDLVSSQGARAVISTRLALARLAEEPFLEGSLFANVGKKTRKSGLYTISANFFSQAEATFASIQSKATGRNANLADFLDPIQMQVAKLKHTLGESNTALKMLGQESVQKVVDRMIVNLDDEKAIQIAAITYERQRIGAMSGLAAAVAGDDKALAHRFAGRLLKLTQWMAEGGLKGGAEVMGRFRVIHKLAPQWEKGRLSCCEDSTLHCVPKLSWPHLPSFFCLHFTFSGHFQFGKYVDSVMQSRVVALASRSSQQQQQLLGVEEDLIRAHTIFRDKTCQKYVLMAMNHYATALKLDSKHVYQALPRLLSLWFDFTSIQGDKMSSDKSTSDASISDPVSEYCVPTRCYFAS
jgi:serine/threonine-protein kinase ATR